MNAPRRAAIYARVSTDKQNPLSTQDQIRKCREHAAARGLQVLDAHIYCDESLSGSGSDRPGLQRLLRAALDARRSFDTILVDDTSRLSRSTADALSLFSRLNFAGVQLCAVSQGIDSEDDQAEVLLTVHGMVDSLYVRELGKKTHRGLESRMLRGFHAGGRCYGYSNEKTDAGVRLVVDKAEARVVRRIFALSAAGKSLRTITKTLNAERIPAPRPRKGRTAAGWCPTAVREMLRNERYAGRLVWNRSRFVKVPGTNRRVARPRPQSEWRTAETPETRIVPEKLWKAVQERIRWQAASYKDGGPGGFFSREAGTRYLFSGLLRCSECGGRLTILSGRRGHAHPRYGCPRNFYRGTCGNALRERRDRIEERLLAGLQTEVLQPAAVEYAVRQAEREINRQLRGMGSNLEKLRARKAQLEREIQNHVRALAEGYSPALTAALAERERELAAISERILGAGEASLRADLDELRKLVASKFAELRAALCGEVEAARAELQRHIAQITMRPEGEGEARHYVASGAWDYLGVGIPSAEAGPAANLAFSGRTAARPLKKVVAGAGFEPATSGL